MERPQNNKSQQIQSSDLIKLKKAYKEKLDNLDETINSCKKKLKNPKPTFFLPFLLASVSVATTFAFPLVGVITGFVSFFSYLYQNDKKQDYMKQKDELEKLILEKDQILQPQETNSKRDKTTILAQHNQPTPGLSPTTLYNKTHKFSNDIIGKYQILQ